ncbi:hypothetical protein GYMLUDRAFT_253084 [Collybiopsis luxurians FD-317 M1]|uniref:Uncharacterized protein n=1 Tax=Collybiopsis luxurians FD-317 M1 TaxID=944289 RepID=A0A0D0B870_9AGAR|nr:hypothetical protein GYMLUDRAFT_253084 [Collybiopsis luxurians FD-317 M1]
MASIQPRSASTPTLAHPPVTLLALLTRMILPMSIFFIDPFDVYTEADDNETDDKGDDR